MKSNDEKTSLEEQVEEIIESSDAELGPYGESYYVNIDSAAEMGEEAVETQIRYIENNIPAVDEESKKLKENLRELVNDDEEEDVEDENVLTEIEAERIESGIMSFTEDKVNSDELITITDFEKFSLNTGYSLEKVLSCNPWMSYCLTEKANKRVQEAKKNIELDF